MRKSTVFMIGIAVFVMACNPDYKKAMEYKAQGDWANAQEAMLKAIEASPKDAGYRNELGFIYHKRRYYELAEKEYTLASNLDPYYVEAHYNRGSVLYDMRKYNISRQSFEKVLKLDPNNAKALNALALVIHLGEKNHQLALEKYKKAIKLEPDNPAFFGNLCALYKDMNETQKADEACKRSNSLKSGSGK